jgi:hypothetical protein
MSTKSDEENRKWENGIGAWGCWNVFNETGLSPECPECVNVQNSKPA